MDDVINCRKEWRGTLYRFWRRIAADPVALVSIIFLLIVIAAAIFCKQMVAADPLFQNLGGRLLPPSGEYPFGTDALGRDMLARIVYGTRNSVVIAASSVAIGMIVGTTMGLLAGYLGGKLDIIIMRLVDLQMAFTSFLIIMIIVVMIGPGVVTLIIMFAFTTWIIFARIVRGCVVSLRESQFILAARSLGCSDMRIVFRHILPNVMAIVASLGILETARVMVGEAGLSFIGFGIQPPAISWGLLISEGRDYMVQAWWLTTLPGLAIAATVLAINLVGIWLRSVTDPFQRKIMGVRR